MSADDRGSKSSLQSVPFPPTKVSERTMGASVPIPRHDPPGRGGHPGFCIKEDEIEEIHRDIGSLRNEVAEGQGRVLAETSDIRRMIGGVGNPTLDQEPSGVVKMLVNIGTDLTKLHHKIEEELPKLSGEISDLNERVSDIEDKEEQTLAQGRKELLAKLQEERKKNEEERKRVEDLRKTIDKMKQEEQERLRKMVFTIAKILIPIALGTAASKPAWDLVVKLLQ